MTAAHPEFQVGALVWVEIDGQLVFPKPVAIEKIYDNDGEKWFIVEGSTTGLIADNLALAETSRSDARPTAAARGRRGMIAAGEEWIARARAAPIEVETARRGIRLTANGAAERVGPCPVCGGEDRFAINIQKQVFNCRGCGAGGDVIKLVEHIDKTDFLTACETLTGEPRPQPNGKNRAAKARKIVVAQFEYHSSDGALVFAVERIEYRNPDGSAVLTRDGKPKKSFRQKRPDPDRPGEWIWNVDGAPVVPYRLPELIDAAAAEHFILIVEGEAKADLLHGWNVPATCCAGKWRKEHSAFLAAADVILLPDNDEPGRQHADTIAKSLQGIAKSVRVLDLPGLPPRGDILDWARNGGTADELHRLIEHEAKPWVPSAPPPAPATDPRIEQINISHALVLSGGQASIMKFESETRFRLLTINAFKHWFENHRWIKPPGKRKEVSLGEYWMRNPQRRDYEGIEFDPGGAGRPSYYNLWQGFAVQPRTGDCSKFLAHLKDNAARGDEETYRWIVGWFAQIVQQPTIKMETALVIRGEFGTGKTKIGQVFGSLFGIHYLSVASPRFITGQFNSHMASLLLLHAEEAFWAGDRKSEGILKDLVSGATHQLEYKRIDPITVKNYIRLLVTGNPDWLVPAGFKERRWTVLDIGEDHIQDKPYFAAIDREMNNGGREALLHHLINFDLKQVDLRTIPKTAALLDQQIETLNPEQAWWLDTLKRGELPAPKAEPKLNLETRSCIKEDLYMAYIEHAKLQGVSRRSIETKLAMFLNAQLEPDLQDTKSLAGTRRVPCFRFPTLADCRKRFTQKMGQNIKWGDQWENDEWVHRAAQEPDQNPYRYSRWNRYD
jgi:hypothetical protein